MSLDPHNLLPHVHPDLVKVLKAAKQTPAFMIVQGLRTTAQERDAVNSGHSQTMHSRHLPNKQGFACAIDLAALDQAGHINWSDVRLYQEIAANIKQAAGSAHVPVEWGGDWHTLKDYGHFQLPWAQYP